MSVIRALPARPSLAFDRKQAKTLLRQLRAGDPEAIARSRPYAPALATTSPERVQLADAQLVIAREYGFSSWPRLVQYHHGVVRQSVRHGMSGASADNLRASVGWMLEGHRRRHPQSVRALAAYVPRFFGRTPEEVMEATVTEDEARLAVARSHGAPSWEVLLDRATEGARLRGSPWERTPLQQATAAMRAADLPALERVVAEHPALLHPSEVEEAAGATLLHAAIGIAHQGASGAMQEINRWLAAHGFDRQRALNLGLCHLGLQSPERVRWLIEQGADPDWVAPNGCTVLELAIVNCWNGDIVDAIAAHARPPRRALWIASGLGDIHALERMLDARGRPLPAARMHRPPLDASRRGWLPQLPDADDEEIVLEAFHVAMINGRTQVMELFVSRGFDVNTLRWEVPVITLAVGNRWARVLECLVRCGADLDLRGPGSRMSARESAREMVTHGRVTPEARHIAELCGIDVDAVRATPATTAPTLDRMLQDALTLAADDARRDGAKEIGEEHLLFGMLRAERAPALYFAELSGIDRPRFHSDHAARLAPSVSPSGEVSLPFSLLAQARLDAAAALAASRRHKHVSGLHLLSVLLARRDGPAQTLVRDYGGDIAALTGALAREV